MNFRRLIVMNSPIYKNRGMLLESIINQTLRHYREAGVALFHKKSVPVRVKRASENAAKPQAEVVAKSTTDYYGVWQGSFLAFEAKSTTDERIALSNLKLHQRNYLEEVTAHQGIAFLIVLFAAYDEFYVIPYHNLASLTQASITRVNVKAIGRAVELTYPGIIDFLPAIAELF